MAAPDKGKRTTNRTPRRKPEPVPVLRVRPGATLKEIYAAARKAFTAEDLQKYTVEEKCVPVSELLALLDELDRQAAEKKRGRRKHAG